MRDTSSPSSVSSSEAPRWIDDKRGCSVHGLSGSDTACEACYPSPSKRRAAKVQPAPASLAGTPEQTEAPMPELREVPCGVVFATVNGIDLRCEAPKGHDRSHRAVVGSLPIGSPILPRSATPASSDVLTEWKREYTRLRDEIVAAFGEFVSEGDTDFGIASAIGCSPEAWRLGRALQNASARYNAILRGAVPNALEILKTLAPEPKPITAAERASAPVPPSASITVPTDECTNPNCQWLKCAGGLSADLTRFGRELDRVCEAIGVESMKDPKRQADAAIAAIEALRPASDALREHEMETLRSAWPPRDVVQRLLDAADHLLKDRDYDAHGYETMASAATVARDWLARPESSPAVDAPRLVQDRDGWIRVPGYFAEAWREYKHDGMGWLVRDVDCFRCSLVSHRDPVELHTMLVNALNLLRTLASEHVPTSPAVDAGTTEPAALREIEQLIADYGNAGFACGEWDTDDDQPFDSYVAAQEAIGKKLMAKIRALATRAAVDDETVKLSRDLARAVGEYRGWANGSTRATTIAAIGAEAMTHLDTIARACDALTDAIYAARRSPDSVPEANNG